MSRTALFGSPRTADCVDWAGEGGQRCAREPGDLGPRRIREDELGAAFADGRVIDSITADPFDINPGTFPGETAQAWRCAIRRA